MNKTLLAGMLAALPGLMVAQTAIDAYSISQNDFRGSARFMSMGGAFTALGGDISTLNQNPAGIGVYRSSDISATLDINMQSAKFKAAGLSNTVNQTKVACNNFGYVGSINLGSNSVMPFFNWGVSYSRVASFDRHFSGSLGNIGTSYTNLVADYTSADGYSPSDLWSDDYKNYNPYLDSSAPWSSILTYGAYGINPVSVGSSSYIGLYDEGKSTADAYVNIEEKGHVDEYAIDFGGNISDVVYWGIGFGITDIDYRTRAYYDESISNANVAGPDATQDPSYVNGTASLGMTNYKHIWGSGFNFKAGVIFKPINEFRLGLSIHTPTYYNLSYEGSAYMDYAYQSPTYNGQSLSGTAVTDEGYLDEFDWKCRTPWRLMVGAAGVIGGRAIISADYEYRAANDIKVQDFDGNDYVNENEDVKTYYKAQNIMRLGLEYRVTPQFSVRAGYVYESSPVTSEAMDGYSVTPNGAQATYVYTSGPGATETLPSYTLDKTTQYITCGLGYRYKNFYADAAYVHRTRKSKFSAFTDYNENSTGDLILAPTGTVSDNNNSIVLTVGFRF
ncbi:MAG: outer membrane protein transport protein [Bacteroides sp.]|nr:outer membrane protein transport protein [Bacteroides sp.]